MNSLSTPSLFSPSLANKLYLFLYLSNPFLPVSLLLPLSPISYSFPFLSLILFLSLADMVIFTGSSIVIITNIVIIFITIIVITLLVLVVDVCVCHVELQNKN